MEESAPKRRRVSPDPRAPRASPGTQAQTNPSTTSTSQSPTRRLRPSFASPTRASLSRFNPQILDRRRSASASPPKAATTAPINPTLGAARSARQLFGPQAAQTRTEIVSNIGASESNQPQGTTRPTEGNPRPVTSSQIGSTIPFRRTPVRPSPRPLPPPAPEGDDEIGPFLGRMQRREPNTGVPIPPPPEPELPPAVSDPVSSTPPRGIHSSPRWRDRERTKKNSPLKSSPLKPRAVNTLSRRLGVSQSPGGSPARREQPLQDRNLNTNTNAARQVPAHDKNIHKLKERLRLRREIAVLRREIELAARENERIRVMQRAGRVVAPENEEDVLNLVQKTLVVTRTAPTPGLAHQMTQAALNPTGILPFGPSRLVLNQGGDDEGDESNIKSHHPVPMSAADDLPFLQLFSPFSATSQVSVLPSVQNQPLRQRRQITLRSRDIPGLFTARLDMVVNAMNLNILALKVPALEPCARPELGPFVEKICSGDCNRTMQHNVGILSWAMGEWYRMAVRRAQFWFQLEQSLAAKGDYLSSIARLRTQPESDVDDTVDDDVEQCSKADLFRFLGQQSYDAPIPTLTQTGPEAAVRLEWRIELDWTGEAQSKMSLFLGIPGKWRQADERGVFGQFPKLFEDLIEGGQPPRKAVRTIMALLTGG